MNTVHVSYHHEHGWQLIDEATFANPQPDGPVTYKMRSVALNDGDNVNLRATFAEQRFFLPSSMIDRAEDWLIEQQFAWKTRGLLLVNWPVVEKELERLEAERREGA